MKKKVEEEKKLQEAREKRRKELDKKREEFRQSLKKGGKQSMGLIQNYIDKRVANFFDNMDLKTNITGKIYNDELYELQ